MSKALVIVESPAKAKTINKYLSDYYIVRSSIGHIRDLLNSGSSKIEDTSFTCLKKPGEDIRSTLIKHMGVNPWCNWKAHYEIIPGKEKIVHELKKLADKVDHIYLATDPDREGEAIAWHLREVIGGDNERYSRVVFNEITENAIQKAFENPRKLNIDRVHAQQARRFIDRVVGYMISPLLWKKIARGLSAGRVQSVAVRLVVEREQEIKTFVPSEYWKIHANVKIYSGEAFQLQVTHQNDRIFLPKSLEQTLEAIALLKKYKYTIFECKHKLVIRKPNAPFITTTLQQIASSYLGFSVKKTMLIAQRLYEAGYITYIRTDRVNLSQDSINMVRNYIKKNFGKEYLPENANLYIEKKPSQEAHEAIRPSNITLIPEELKEMGRDAKELYRLIWCRFVSCQMVSAKYKSIVLTAVAGNFRLKACSHTLCFDGWIKVMKELHQNNKENISLPTSYANDKLSLVDLVPTRHFTKPPPRFSESSLVKELEKRGIGRPSTYTSIISTIQDRGYVRIENRRFHAEKIGEIVTDRLKKSFRQLMSYDFTSKMEYSLDQIASSKKEWKKVLDEFFVNFTLQLNKAEKDPEKGGMQSNRMILTSISCPACKRKMRICISTTGVFLGCSSYILPHKERCKTTINLVSEDKVFSNDSDMTKSNALRIKKYCKKCGTIMDGYLIDSKRKLYICGNNPICGDYEVEKGSFYAKNYFQFVRCKKCSSEMHPKIGRFGKYMACTNSACRNTSKVLHDGEIVFPKEDPVPFLELPCEKSDAYFVLHDGSRGVFLAAHTFPKSRETRSPSVEELHRFRDRLPTKFHYLADAPQKDPQGNKTVVYFNSKTKEQYVAVKKNKTTEWSAHFVNGKWIEKKVNTFSGRNLNCKELSS